MIKITFEIFDVDMFPNQGHPGNPNFMSLPGENLKLCGQEL